MISAELLEIGSRRWDARQSEMDAVAFSSTGPQLNNFMLPPVANVSAFAGRKRVPGHLGPVRLAILLTVPAAPICFCNHFCAAGGILPRALQRREREGF